METITDKTILDDIIKQLCKNDTDSQCRAYANYDDGNIYIDATVVWEYQESENWVVFEGRRYYEGTYTDVVGWDDLQVDAWIGDNKAEVDIDYIEKNLIKD